MKLHLDKTALERETVDRVARRWFKPADIEELRGLEFHHRAQKADESIEQYTTAREDGKDFDRLLNSI